jgi:glyoxylate/hydroxypyruvate reductase A
MLPPGWDALGKSSFASPAFEAVLAGREEYKLEEITYFSGFRPPPGFLKTLPNLKALISLGAGVDGFLRDPELPRHLPLVRFVDPTLMHEMAQYVVMHVLIAHRAQRFFDAAQQESAWRQRMLARPSRDTRIGILGLGDIGGTIAASLLPFDFQLSGWSRSRKDIPNVKSYAGAGELPQFLAQCDYCVCVLPMTEDTKGIMNAALFAQLPKGAWVINVARGGHLIEEDLIAALDSGHLGGAVLDVFQTEPLPTESPIWLHPKITATPHIAGITDADAALAYVADCVTRCETGTALENVVDLTKGY